MKFMQKKNEVSLPGDFGIERSEIEGHPEILKKKIISHVLISDNLL